MRILSRIARGTAIVVLLAPLTFAPLSAAPTPALRVQGTLNQIPLLRKAAAAYDAQNANVTVDVKGTNSGQGIAALREGTIDVAASDIAVSYPGFSDTTIGVLGVSVIAGPHTGVKNLTREQLAAIYLGKIKNWKEVGGEDQPIVLFGRAIGTGVRYLFEQKVVKSPIASSNPVNPNVLVATIAATPGALGYVGSYFVRNQPGLILSFDGVLPTPENIRSHRYAFSTDEHLYTRSGGSPDARAFAAFVAAQHAMLNSSGIY